MFCARNQYLKYKLHPFLKVQAALLAIQFGTPCLFEPHPHIHLQTRRH